MRPRRVVLWLEQLENRLAPAVITVTTTADDIASGDGSVSLREAITAVNAGNDLGDPDITAQTSGQTFGPIDFINFNIPGSGVQTINVGTDPSASGLDLPAIIHPVVINGYSENNGTTQATANTLANSDNAVILIEVNGAGAATDGLVLAPGSDNSTIKGLVVNRFHDDGIILQSKGNRIVGNFVGVNPAGTTRMPNGTYPLDDGILVENSSNNMIGTPAPADRNVVSGNAVDGIHILGTLAAPAIGNSVQNNFVGVAADGVSSVGNRTEPAPATGTAEGNNLTGIEITGGNDNTIGGSVVGARNVVGFNVDGIEIDNGGQGNTIQANFVGVGADGVTPVKNLLHGIVLRSSNGFAAPLGPPELGEPGVSFNLIGGTFAGAGNLVEFNGAAGIAVFGNTVSASGQPNVGNAIEGNSVFQNGRNNPTSLLGIDLSNASAYPTDDGITPNDSQGHGAANDPNNFQDFPVLATASPAGGGTNVTGTLKGSPNSAYRIEFFANNADPAGGSAEGQQFLGFTNVTTDASGSASFSSTLNVPVANGRIVTATATDGSGNTSEFSAGLSVMPLPPPPPPPPPPSSAPPPSVSIAFAPGGQVTVLVTPSGLLYQFDPSGAHFLGSGARTASVVFLGGAEVLDVVYTNGLLYQFDPSGGHLLGSSVQNVKVAFAGSAEVLEVLYTDGTLYQFDPSGGHLLGSGVQDVSVAFGSVGEVLDVVYTNGQLFQYDQFGSHFLASGVQDVDVTFAGNTEVIDAVFTDGTLYQFDASGGHVLGTGVKTVSAAFGPSGEALDIIYSDNSLVQYNAAGAHKLGALS